MLLLSKEANEKDRSLKTWLLLSTNSQSPEKISREVVWKKLVFSLTRADSNLLKRNFPENTLCYVNQGYISAVKGSELAIYNHILLLEQMTITTNQPNDIEMDECKRNETKLIKCLYDKMTGDFLGLQKELAYIVLRGGAMECFFPYGYNTKKSKVLYSATKDKIQMLFIITSFKKHFHEVLSKLHHTEEFSTLFYFHPSNIEIM